MKKIFVSVSLFFIFIFVSADTVSTVHPLIGKWKCKYKIGTTYFTDYITISSVSTSGYVKGKDQYNTVVFGYTKNNIVFLTHEKNQYLLQSYYWGYNGIAFAKMLAAIEFGGYPFYSKWYTMIQPIKGAAISSNLTECDSAEWSKSQSVLIDMLQSQDQQE